MDQSIIQFYITRLDHDEIDTQRFR